MEDQLIEPEPAQEVPRNRGGGPSTPEGKARSSMNRLTHGCRSEKTVLPEEKGEEFDALLQDWLAHYHPGSPASLTRTSRNQTGKRKLLLISRLFKGTTPAVSFP